MALDTPPLQTAKRNFAFGLETTTGTKLALTATSAVTRCFEPAIKYDTEKVDRPTNDIFPVSSRPGQRKATVTFGNEMYSASTQPKWLDLLRGCGFDDTGTANVFLPVVPAAKTLTFGMYRPGRSKYAIGCMGTGVIKLRRGQPARVDWTYTGLQDIPDATALATITYDDTAPLYVGAVSFSLGTGATLTIPEADIDLGAQVIIRDDISGVDSAGGPTGGRAAYITSLKPMVKISPEALALTARDWYAARRNGTSMAMSCTLGSGSNKLVISAPALQMDEDVDETDDNGLLRDGLTLMCTGTNYLSLDFTAGS